MKTAYHHGDLRNALVQAGLQILRENDVHSLSLREVARLAGVSQAAPYRHFTNKESLLAAIAQEGFVLLSSKIRAVITRLSSSPKEQFHACNLEHFRLATEHPDHFRLMFGGGLVLNPKDHPELARAARESFDEFVQVIANCQRAQLIKSGDPQQMAIFAWSGVHGFATLYIDHRLDFYCHNLEQAQSLLDSLSRSLLNGMSPD
jgi:AcrR family transcriptional regulator